MKAKTLDLRGLTEAERDAKVNEAIAVSAAGYTLSPGPREPAMSHAETPEPWCYKDNAGRFYLGEPYSVSKNTMGLTFGYMWVRPKYVTSADAVLPLLEKWPFVEIVRGNRSRKFE